MAFARVRRRLAWLSACCWLVLVPLVLVSVEPASPWRLPTIIFGVATVGSSMLWVQAVLLEDVLPMLKDWLKGYLLGLHDGSAGHPPDPGRRLWSVG